MTVYVDDARLPARDGRLQARWSHLSADTELELHDFADQLGLRSEWFQDSPDRLRRHYDLTDSKRRQAIALGARAETWCAGARRRIEARRYNAVNPAAEGGPGGSPAPLPLPGAEFGSTGHTAPHTHVRDRPAGGRTAEKTVPSAPDGCGRARRGDHL